MEAKARFFGGFVIFVIIAFQLTWLIIPRTGSSMADTYRFDERAAAFKQNAEAPSLRTRIAIDQEMRLLSEHTRFRNISWVALNLLFDTVLILLFWRWLRRASRRQLHGIRTSATRQT